MNATRFAGALFAVLLLTSCAAHTVRIADLKDRPGHYEARTIKVHGLVTSSWSLPLAPLQGGIAIVQAFLHTGDLGPPGAHLRLGVVFHLERGFLGREIGFPAFGLGFALRVLDDGGRVGAGLRLAAGHPRAVNKVSQDSADGYAEDQSQDQQQNIHRLSFQRTRREYGGPASS